MLRWIFNWIRSLFAKPVTPEVSANVAQPQPEQPVTEVRGMKKALLVGINKYMTPGNDLNGCVNDISEAHALLCRVYGFDADNIRALADERATQQAILERLEWLVADAKPGDELVFWYSGHGSQTRDRSGDELDDGMDEILCVSGDSVVTTDRGIMFAQALYDLVQNGEKIKIKNGGKFYTVSRSHKSRKNRVVNLTLTNGMPLSLGETHPVCVLRDGQEVLIKARNLCTDDKIIKSTEIWNESVPADPLWHVIGLFVGDGYFKSGLSIRFGVRDHLDWWKNDLPKIVEKIPGATISFATNCRNDTIVNIKGDAIISKIKEMGFVPYKRKCGEMPKNMFVPMNPSAAKGFLRGLYDSDGSSAKDHVTFSSKDLALAKLVCVTLNLFGIRGGLAMSKRGYWSVNSYDRNAHSFKNKVGFSIKCKQDKIGNRTSSQSGEKGENDLGYIVDFLSDWNIKWKSTAEFLGLCPRNTRRRDTEAFRDCDVPVMIGYLRNLDSSAVNVINGDVEYRKDIGASIGQIEKKTGTNQFTVYSRQESGDYSDSERYAKEFRGDISSVLCKSQVKDSLCSIGIRKIEIVDKEMDMFDFTVNEAHRFEIDGIRVHNCPTDLDWDNPLLDDVIADFFKRVPVGARLTMISDSCHSGSIDKTLRGPDDPEMKMKFITPPIDIALRSKDRELSLKKIGVGKSTPEQQRHVLLSGCRDSQTSADANINGIWHGALSWAILKTLNESPDQTYEQLAANVTSIVKSKRFSQDPQLVIGDSNRGKKVFGGRHQ